MRLISHRGNICGKPIHPDKENRPSDIERCLDYSYDVEVDVWCIGGIWYLGHDRPQYEINLQYLLQYNKRLLVHAKNPTALEQLWTLNIECFYHQNDDYAFTNFGTPIIFPGQVPLEGGICMLPEKGNDTLLEKCAGICSDYISNYYVLYKN